MTKELTSLYFRRALCQHCIRTLDYMSLEELQTFGVGETERQSAMDEYKRQLAVIDGRIAEIEGIPPPVSVGLKTAVLFAKSEKGD